MNNGPTKAHATPYGASVIPSNGTLNAWARPQTPAGSPAGEPSIIPGSLDVAGLKMVEENAAPAAAEPSPIAKALEGLLDAFAETVANKVLARIGELAATVDKTAPEPEDLRDGPIDRPDSSHNRVVQQLVEQPQEQPTVTAEDPERAAQMHTDLEQALREREHVDVVRYSPSPIGFQVHFADDSGAHECIAYAGSFGQGYTNGAKPNEYALICDGKRMSWVTYEPETLTTSRYQKAFGGSFTLDQLLGLVDKQLRGAEIKTSWAINTIDLSESTSDATA